MSEDDRAAKAARAKAMLKKRQQKKAGGASASGLVSPASPPPSRPFTPAVSEAPPPDEQKRDLADLFAAHDPHDTSWLSSLQRAVSPTSPPPPPPPAATTSPPFRPSRTSLSGTSQPPSTQDAELQIRIQSLQAENTSLVTQLHESEQKLQQTEASLQEERSRLHILQTDIEKLQQEKETLIRNEQQTVSLLVSEKASLASNLERLEGLEAEADSIQQLLQGEKAESSSLRERLRTVQADVDKISFDNGQLRAKERELTDKTRDQERALQLMNVTSASLTKEADEHKRKYRELEEQIQSDDRLEKLENTLKNTQDRTVDLELKLSLQKHAYIVLKEERDRISGELEQHLQAEESWRSRHVALEAEHNSVKETLITLESEKTSLDHDKDALQSEVHSIQTDITLLQEKLTQAALELASQTRQLQAVQAELKSAKRRAEEAESIQTELQSEGTDLMRSLEEMRPKIVQLTGEKLELSEKVSGLESEVRARDAAISQLEAEMDEHRAMKEDAERRLNDNTSRFERERNAEKGNNADLQKAHAELVEELEAAMATVRTLEKERSLHRQETSRQIQEMERMAESSASQANQIAALTQEADQNNMDRSEEQEYLMQAQSEIEGLRQAIESRDEEIERLRIVASATSDTPRSLDDEMLSSLRQNHALELSAAQSRIRSLESAIFDAEARAHELQKHVAMLEDQRPRAFSPPPILSRPSSRGGPSIPRSRVIDQNLSPEARHKRKVSLSMLKARIDREGANGKLPPLVELSDGSHALPNHGHGHIHNRPQFLDDSHVFWCSSCSGDLVIL